jgi:hypothetical protein
MDPLMPAPIYFECGALVPESPPGGGPDSLRCDRCGRVVRGTGS